MIFLTVGTQLPFDRLVRAVDVWAADRHGDIFGQIAEPGPVGHVPRNFDWVPHLDPETFRQRFAAANLVVSHAGMGSLISALVAPKPILILPRRASLGEQRNDHQLATARRFADRAGVTTCMDETEVGLALDGLTSVPWNARAEPISGEASPELIATLRTFIQPNIERRVFSLQYGVNKVHIDLPLTSRRRL